MILTIQKKLPFTSSNDEICTKLFPTETGAGSDTGMFTSSYCLQSVLLTSADSIILTPAMNPVGRPIWTQISVTQWQTPGTCCQELYFHYILLYLTCCSNVSSTHANVYQDNINLNETTRKHFHKYKSQNILLLLFSPLAIFWPDICLYTQPPPIYIKNISSSRKNTMKMWCHRHWM